MDSHLRVFGWFLELRQRNPELYRVLVDTIRDQEQQLDDRWKDWPATCFILVVSAGIIAGHWWQHII